MRRGTATGYALVKRQALVRSGPIAYSGDRPLMAESHLSEVRLSLSSY